MSSTRARARRGGALATVVLLAVTVAAASACTPPPGPPLPAGLTPAPAGTPATSVVDLLGDGYTESEHFFTGVANTYLPAGTLGIDGRWDKVVDQARQPYSTRLLVDRPTDPARFNGTVRVEWLNVTAGSDLAASVVQARDHIVATGAAWVGVSAQATGVNSLRQSDPDRYASLHVASDSLSYDIFSQVGQAVRDHPELLGGKPARQLLAVGDSQSALRLTTYVNAWQEARVYDGFIIHSRFTAGAPIGDDAALMYAFPTRVRDDADRPVLQLQTETEVDLDLGWLSPDLGSWEDARQPDAGNVHTWEVTGAAHADKYLVGSEGAGLGVDVPALLALFCASASINDFPMRYAANAAFAAVERWAGGGGRPATTPPIATVDGEVQRDADGNARGGLRLPDIDVPIARHEGGANPNFVCALFGSATPFTAAQLQARYGTSTAYVAAYRSRADAAVAAGIMTAADRDTAVAKAAAVPIGP